MSLVGMNSSAGAATNGVSLMRHPMHQFDDDVVTKKEVTAEQQSAIEHRWSPYVSNGGTVLSVVGPDYCVVAGDTRMSTGYRIYTRNATKITKLTDKVVIASGGMQAEINTLHRVLKTQVALYRHNHRKQPSVGALAQLLSTLLYYKRFFPYYTFNIIAGVDEDGVGKCFGYDAIGSHDSAPYVAQGTGIELIMSVLDNQVMQTNQEVKRVGPLTKDQAIELGKDVVTSACERDIFTGDSANIVIITSEGIEESILPMKRD